MSKMQLAYFQVRGKKIKYSLMFQQTFLLFSFCYTLLQLQTWLHAGLNTYRAYKSYTYMRVITHVHTS